jgi:hypothetical protein
MLVAAPLAATPASAQEEEWVTEEDDKAEEDSEPVDKGTPSSDPESETLALKAQQVISQHCAEAAGGNTTKAAIAVAQVSDVWARVSTQLDQGHKVYLLYWRGVLGQCLDQEERAIEDLRAFVAVRADSELWAGLVEDANSRLRRLEKSLGKTTAKRPPPPPPPVLPPPTRRSGGIALGIGLSSAAVATGMLSAWQGQQAQAQLDLMYSEPHPRRSTTGVLSLEDLEAAMNTHARASYVLTGTTVALGIGSAVAFVLAATSKKGAAGSAAAVPIVVPVQGGAAALWEIRW